MRIERYQCPLCEWKHEEVDALSAIPQAMLQAFSEPLALSNIMMRQKAQRIEAALSEHLAKHTTAEWLKKVSGLQWELDQIKASFP